MTHQEHGETKPESFTLQDVRDNEHIGWFVEDGLVKQVETLSPRTVRVVGKLVEPQPPRDETKPELKWSEAIGHEYDGDGSHSWLCGCGKSQSPRDTTRDGTLIGFAENDSSEERVVPVHPIGYWERKYALYVLEEQKTLLNKLFKDGTPWSEAADKLSNAINAAIAKERAALENAA